MKNNFYLFRIGLICFFIWFMTNCSTPDCIFQNGFLIGIHFYNSSNKTPIQIDINRIRILEENDIILYQNNSLNVVEIPLNPENSEIKILFDTEYGFDTLTFTYNKMLKFISEECGSILNYDQINVINHSFDSIKIITNNTQLNFLDKKGTNENIRIYN